MEENCWIMERILQFADSKTTGERWIFFSENVRKCVDNAAFSNIHNLFSERVNTTFFAVGVAVLFVCLFVCLFLPHLPLGSNQSSSTCTALGHVSHRNPMLPH